MTPVASAVCIVDKDKDRDKTPGKASGAEASADADAVPSVGPHHRALGEIYQRLYPEVRRPKPNQQAIAEALHAMQRLTMEADSETVAEEAVDSEAGDDACRVCGHHNRAGNKFCGGCGAALEAESAAAQEPAASSDNRSQPETPPSGREAAPEVHPPAGSPAGAHYYHHHYHHHYFEGRADFSAAPAPRPGAAESVREADRMRVAAAAKGEPMSKSEAAVRRLTQKWVLACNTRQLDELLELYAPDALVLRTNLPPIRGAMALREFFYSSLEAGLGDVAVDPIRVEVSGDLAHEVGRYSALVPGTAGKRREERGKYLWVFARQPSGDWKLISECWSSDLTLAGPESDFPKTAIAPAKAKK